MTIQQPERPADRRDRAPESVVPMAVFAIAKLIFHLLTNSNYGFHRDELATLDDARHLAWGYVAYPPLTPFLGRLELMVFGPSLTGFRFLAAAAQSAVIILAALMAREFGGRRTAMWIAAVAVAIAPISLGASSLFQYVSFDDLWWVLIAWLVVRLVKSDDPRWWVGIGAVIGLAVLTKYTIVFYVAGVVLGVVLSPLRAHLRSRWLWFGVAVSVVIALPNLLWQVSHDFVSLEFLRSIHARDVSIGRTDHFLSQQLTVASNPLTAPLWMAGLVAFLFSARLSRFRILGIMAVVPFLLFLLAHGRGYYLGPVYPMLLAGGSVVTMDWLDSKSTSVRRIATALIAVLLLVGSAVALAILPIAPIDSRLGRFASSVNGDLKEEVGWPELVGEIARVWQSLPRADRARTAIFCSNYGEAGAVDLYGPALGLPPAIGVINSYWARGYGARVPDTFIMIGAHREMLDQHFRSVVPAGRIPNPHNVENEEAGHPEIYICRGPRIPWPQLWARARSFG